jgi:hypothetical protein
MVAAPEAPIEKAKGFEDFLERVREPGSSGLLSPVRFSEVPSIDLVTLAAQAGVHRSTMRHAPDTESVQHFLRQTLRVIRAAYDLSGDLGKALFWYRNYPIREFGYRMPRNWWPQNGPTT